MVIKATSMAVHCAAWCCVQFLSLESQSGLDGEAAVKLPVPVKQGMLKSWEF